MQVITAAEQLFFVTVRLDAVGAEDGTGPDVGWTGTGFAYQVPTDRGNAHFLVTNKHVLQYAKQLRVSMIAASPEGTPALGKPASIELAGLIDDAWIGHPSPDVDVAAASLSPLVNFMAAQGTGPFFRCADPTMCLTSERALELDALESVVFVGYPSGIYDTTNLLPIVRRGMAATPMTVDYLGLPAFLIDAAVFPGSSGSPVFLLDRGIYQRRTGGAVVGSRLMLLGVLAQYYSRAVEGPVREVPARQVASVQEALGLGIVFRAETIEPCIQPLLDRAGLTRATPKLGPTSGSTPSQADAALDKATRRA
ncbi:MAG: serine protease [Candidatus Limnocylindrales bacterium]|jgi:S1-C subfamily serine protease